MKTTTEFIKLATDKKVYDDQKKRRFHRLGKALMRTIVKELGLPEGSYTIRSNMGGCTVSGEVILHANKFYVQFYQSAFLGDHFLYRDCNGQDDYTGGPNRFYNYSKLEDLGDFVKILRKLTGI